MTFWLHFMAVSFFCVFCESSGTGNTANLGLSEEAGSDFQNDFPIRYTDLTSGGIKVGKAKVSTLCPPPIQPVFNDLCKAPKCANHKSCTEAKTACCFNGCIHTCLVTMDPPSVFDWIEDRPSHLSSENDTSIPQFPIRFESNAGHYVEGGKETVSLPGGCLLSSVQFAELKTFMTADSIDDCKCDNGEVFCAVKKKEPKK